MREQIPIFFSTDDNYAPYLDVALISLIDNASPLYDYKIIILNTGISPENKELLKGISSERILIELKKTSFLPTFSGVKVPESPGRSLTS